jgi:hypothetical protein
LERDAGLTRIGASQDVLKKDRPRLNLADNPFHLAE